MKTCTPVKYDSAVWFDTAGIRVRGSWLRNSEAKYIRSERAFTRFMYESMGIRRRRFGEPARPAIGFLMNREGGLCGLYF